MTSTHYILISSLEPSHVPSALELDQQTLGGKWSENGYLAEIQRENSISLGLVTPNEPQQLIAMGFAWIIADEAHIIMIAVHPQWQRQGFASLLLQQLLTESCRRDCRRSTLEVEASNIPAIQLYQKFGYQTLGERPNYYGSGKNALIMWCNTLPKDRGVMTSGRILSLDT